jgi:hypothetical protein
MEHALDHFLVTDDVVEDTQVTNDGVEPNGEVLHSFARVEREFTEPPPQPLGICFLDPICTEPHLLDRLPGVMCRILNRKSRLHLR